MASASVPISTTDALAVTFLESEWHRAYTFTGPSKDASTDRKQGCAGAVGSAVSGAVGAAAGTGVLSFMGGGGAAAAEAGAAAETAGLSLIPLFIGLLVGGLSAGADALNGNFSSCGK